MADISMSTSTEQGQRSLHDNNTLSNPWEHHLEIADSKEEGYTNMGGLHSFTNDLSGTIKRDVLYSTLYAQVSASSHYERTDQYEEWYSEYVDVLKSVGWKIESFHFNNYSPISLTYSIIEAVKAVIIPHCVEVQKKVRIKLFLTLPDIYLQPYANTHTHTYNIEDSTMYSKHK